MTQHLPMTIDVTNVPQRITGVEGFKELQLIAEPILLDQMGIDRETVAREKFYALQAVEKNLALFKCSPVSILYSLINQGAVGLTLNPVMHMAYLIPRKGQCCLNPSYRGLIKLCTDQGGVLSIGGGVVHEGDILEEFEEGPGGRIKVRRLDLRPAADLSVEEVALLKKRVTDPWSTLMFAYSRALLHNNALDIGVTPRWKLLKIYKMCVKANKDDAPSKVWPLEWMRKTAIAHHTKTLPKSEKAALGVQLFHDAAGPDFGGSGTETQSLNDRLQGAEAACHACEQTLKNGACHNPACPEGEPES